MSGMWNRTLVYLGLREEPEDSYEEAVRPAPDALRRDAHGPGHDGARSGDGGRLVTGGGGEDNVRPLRSGDVLVRSGSAVPRTAVVNVRDFDGVEAVGARYRSGQAVLFDASQADAATARRVLDFVSGLTYALRGGLEKVGGRAFLLVPDGLELSADERRRLGDLGYRLLTGSDG